MSRKHFEALAAALSASAHRFDSEHDRVVAAETVADTCAHFNPNFDRARFLKACGVEV